MIPFDREVFLTILGQYNELIWPAQTAAYALGAMLIYGLLRPGPGSGRTIATILAVFWIWTGLAFHWSQYSVINFAAPAFAALFVAEGFLIAWSGVLRGHLQFQFQRSLRGWCGLAIIGLAALLYPVLGLFTDMAWPKSPAFGLSPEPVALLTLGAFLNGRRRAAMIHGAAAILWLAAAAGASWLLTLPDGLPLIAAAIIGGAMALVPSET